MSSLTDLVSSVLGTVTDAAAGPDVVPGTLPAWAVVVQDVVIDSTSPGSPSTLTLGSDSYDGSVAITLPRDLSGGTFRIVVEGLRDEEYAALRSAGRPLDASVHLWWKDQRAGVLGDLGRLVGAGQELTAHQPDPAPRSRVALIRIDSVRRQAGERRYETVLTGRALAVARLQATPVTGQDYSSFDEAAHGLATAVQLGVVGHGLSGLPRVEPGAEDATAKVHLRDGTAFDALVDLAGQVRAALRLDGPPTAVLRADAVHLGRWTAADTATPRAGVDRVVDPQHGLVAVDRGADADLPPGPAAATARQTVTLISLGRPDIVVGDVVTVPLPDADFPPRTPTPGRRPVSLEDALSGADQTPHRCLVVEVSHRLSARQGFVTTLRAVRLWDDADDGWDPLPEQAPAGRAAAAGNARGSTPADHADGAAGAVRGLAHAVARRAQGLRLLAGQIRRHPAAHLQTLSDVQYAGEAVLEGSGALRSAPIGAGPGNQRGAVPVLTPFAFGRFGLVLPRYPGARVLLADTGGGRDLIDIGALWEEQHSPPARTGDWWLLLPVGASTEDLADGAAPVPPGPEAVHDLIDAAGRRRIELAGLLIQVAADRTDADGRPDMTEAAGLILENAGAEATARVELKGDGTVVIKASGITLDAGDGDIALKGANVKVTVTGTMDVS